MIAEQDFDAWQLTETIL